jgi:energy-coupling factor transporter ATP-binding protein EcfA2
MFMSIYPPRRGDLPPFETAFALQQDNWNDYSFQTLYHLYRRQTGEGNSPTRIGSLKILRKGQTEKDGIQIQRPFDALDEQFCSVGTSLDYYQRLNDIPLEERNQLLTRLRDVVLSPELQEQFGTETGWSTSLFRDDPHPEIFLADANAILTGSFTALAELGLKVSFHPSRWLQALDLNFEARNEWFDLNFFPIPPRKNIPIPHRVIVVIGRNGSGKSTLLSRIARVAFASPSERLTSEYQSIGVFEPPSIGFPKIIAVSYSAFDNFIVPGSSENELRQIASDIERGSGRYVYVGLRDQVAESRQELERLESRELPDDEKAGISGNDRRSDIKLKSLDTLATEFQRLVSKIISNGDESLLDAALQPLSSDPSFADLGGKLRVDLLGDNPKSAFLNWSTGHKIALHVITAIVAHATRRTLVLFDEPEMHLHPPLTAALMHSLRIVLESREALAIVATHSPVILQETLGEHVRVLRRAGDAFEIAPSLVETFGENVGSLTYDIFGLTASSTDYHNVLDALVSRLDSIEEIDRLFTPGLSGQARAYVLSGLAKRNNSR